MISQALLFTKDIFTLNNQLNLAIGMKEVGKEENIIIPPS